MQTFQSVKHRWLHTGVIYFYCRIPVDGDVLAVVTLDALPPAPVEASTLVEVVVVASLVVGTVKTTYTGAWRSALTFES